ncbi:MAG TPA: methyltransferase domain-containing protein [Vicinamibacteria bacterium]|nr:methyltransferase domain-containing protein [Vicinamibacteria bacterium]
MSARPWLAVGVAGFALVALLSAGAAGPRPLPSPSPQEGQHGNPRDLDSYINQLSSPARDAWQKPDQVVAALGLEPGDTACDIGSGPGYFTLRLARAVGPKGFVYAVDVEARMLQALRERLERARVRNVAPVLAVSDDPLLPPAVCDLVLLVDTYHHFPERSAYLQRLRRSLKPGGRIVNIDYHRRPTPVGPPLDHRVAREAFIGEARGVGLAVAKEQTFLPYQYFLVLQPR